MYVHVLLTSVTCKGDGLALRPGRSYPLGRSLDPHWIGGRVSTRIGLDIVQNMKHYCPPGNKTSILRPTASTTTCIPSPSARKVKIRIQIYY
jgi:hypothetical protein